MSLGHVLVASFFAREQTTNEWRKFWCRFRSHQEKLGNALLGAWAGDLFTDDPPPDVESFHQRRLAATYSDVSPDGMPSIPEQIITDAELADAMHRVVDELTFCESTFSGITAAKLGAAMTRLRDSDIVQRAREIRRRFGWMGTMAYATIPNTLLITIIIALSLLLTNELHLTATTTTSDNNNNKSSSSMPAHQKSSAQALPPRLTHRAFRAE